ncbi:MAG TPA: hypothetical protein PKD05_14960 [Candidatus Melainabacteria bacterium]|nr:hypothetical protein [Candidatus Melainabacteria bacterium]HMP52851.1 hypothetical protein [Candidatus Melainabacteria bacterium]
MSKVVRCSYCSNSIEDNVIWCRFCLRVVYQPMAIECGGCGEPVLRTDRFCRFCNKVLIVPVWTFPSIYGDGDGDDDDGFSLIGLKRPTGDPPEGGGLVAQARITLGE